MKKIALCVLIVFCGCVTKCPCSCKNCGIECRNRCEENRCNLGTPCCDGCKCSKLPPIKIK